MCCYMNKEYTEKRLKKLKAEGKTFIYAYKQLNLSGKASNGNYQYKPGWNEMEYPISFDDYDNDFPEGLHLRPKHANFIGTYGFPIIKVKVYIKDIIGFGNRYSFSTSINELVVNRLFISRADWEKAGLPKRRRT